MPTKKVKNKNLMEKDKIELAIESQIAHLESEIKRLRGFQRIYNYSLGGEVVPQMPPVKIKKIIIGKYVKTKIKK